MNRNAQCYYESALRLLLPVEEVPEIDGFKITLSDKSYYFGGSWTPLNNSGGISVARNKYCMNRMLKKAGLPVPNSTVIHISEYLNGKLEEIIADLSFPLAAKPRSGKLGDAVLCNIQTIEQLKHYLDGHCAYFEYITIEEYHGNLNSYRVLLLNYRVIAVIQRYAAHVVGDGKHNILELINLANQKRREISSTLGNITVNEECNLSLKELGIDLGYIPKEDEWVNLGYTCNATRGGTYKTIEKDMIKHNRQMLIRAAKELNLRLVGFDIQCVDINKVAIETSRGVFIEANDGPSVRIHEHPLEGKPFKVTKRVMHSLIRSHPLAYLQALYKHQRSVIYVRSIILMIFLGITYCGLIK